METPANGQSGNSALDRDSLRTKLEQALPYGISFSLRYIHTPPRPCEPLFSALPGQEPEKTRLASHFLAVSVAPDTLTHIERPDPEILEVISFGIEVLVYTSKRLTTVFVSKIDSTPFVPRIRPSPIKATATTFLRWLADEELRKHPRREIVISLFARAQAQYLFPGSADDNTKHVLDDRQLIKWWARTLDPIMPIADQTPKGGSTRYQGYLIVPGYASNELKSFMPPSTGSSPTWLPGTPLRELARTRGLPEYAPPRCLLPRFPDDPKARYMSDLDDEIGIAQESQVTVSPSKKKSGQWKSVRDLDRFWEAMEFRQECSSGRVVGFLWLVISPPGADDHELRMGICSGDSQDSVVPLGAAPPSDPSAISEVGRPGSRSPKKRRRKPLTGPILARQPRLKGGSSGLSNSSELQALVEAQSGEGAIVMKEGYDKAIHTLLQLDFSSLEIASRSTTKWARELRAISGSNEDGAVTVVGSARAEQVSNNTSDGAPAVNGLGGMIKRKRKATDAVVPTTQASSAVGENAAVNVLTAGMVRKKPKPTS